MGPNGVVAIANALARSHLTQLDLFFNGNVAAWYQDGCVLVPALNANAGTQSSCRMQVPFPCDRLTAYTSY